VSGAPDRTKGPAARGVPDVALAPLADGDNQPHGALRPLVTDSLKEQSVYRITDLAAATPAQHRQAAAILVEAFREMAPNTWPTQDAAEAEVRECLSRERICRAAIDAGERVLGWVGGIPLYDGRVWEVHPVAVHPAAQNRGVGRRLLEDLEDEVSKRGGLTLWVGTDDEAGWTSLAGVDLYPDPIAKLATLRNVRRHPFEFYERLGFAVAGVVPDANGFGKPDILMARRVKGSRPP
jgi:aminoglycoside 6'-N-acetyltransferase I